jgi:Tfp pilus assembly pilus retraction ATPase PilT
MDEEKSINEFLAELLFKTPMPESDYTGNMDGAFKVVEAMKRHNSFECRGQFAEMIQVIISDALKLPNGGILAWPDCLYYLTPHVICLAALSTLLSKKKEDAGIIIPFGRKKDP